MTNLEERPVANFYGSWMRIDSCDETELKSQYPMFGQLDYVYYLHQCKINEIVYFKLDQDRDHSRYWTLPWAKHNLRYLITQDVTFTNNL